MCGEWEWPSPLTTPVSLLDKDTSGTPLERQNLTLPRVRNQLVNIPSFLVRVDSQKHIDYALTSPLGGGRPGRLRRKKDAAKAAAGGAGAGDDEEDMS